MIVILDIFRSLWIIVCYIYYTLTSDWSYRRTDVMKLRYFKDDYIFFKIICLDTPDGLVSLKSIPERDRIHKSLKECTQYMLQNISLRSELNDIRDSRNIQLSECRILVYMQEVSSKRSSEPDNLLHYCESALFKFDNHFKCTGAAFNFRKTIDPLLEYAVIHYMGDNALYYNDNTVIAGEYFKNVTTDKELANFLLYNDKAIIY